MHEERVISLVHLLSFFFHVDQAIVILLFKKGDVFFGVLHILFIELIHFIKIGDSCISFLSGIGDHRDFKSIADSLRAQ